MKVFSFYLFYLLTLVLLVFGVLTHTDIINLFQTPVTSSLWPFCLPSAILSIVIALIYHYWFKTGRPLPTWIIMVHFFLVALGLILSFEIYHVAISLLYAVEPDTTWFASDNSTLVVILGPILLVVSWLVFIAGLLKGKRTPTYNCVRRPSTNST